MKKWLLTIFIGVLVSISTPVLAQKIYGGIIANGTLPITTFNISGASNGQVPEYTTGSGMVWWTPTGGSSYTATVPLSITSLVIAMTQANTSTDGWLSHTDWNTFNGKGSGTVTSVTGTSPIVSSGGATPAISEAQANTSTDGYLGHTDWNTFNGKEPALGNPSTNGYVLSSTTGGTRSWVANGGGGSGTVNSATSGNLAYYATTGTAVSGEATFQASNMPALTGDVTTTGGSLATTLATVNSDVGSYTNANITVNAKGLVTAAANGSGGGGISDTAYISGLNLIFDTTTIIEVGTGSAYVPSASAVVTVSSAITNTPSLSASTEYYVYLNGSGALVVSATAPATNYQGTAWEDGSGNRFLGAFRSTSGSTITNFVTTGAADCPLVVYRTLPTAAPFEVAVVTTMTASTLYTASCATIVPPSAVEVYGGITGAYSGGSCTVYFGEASPGLVPTGSTGDDFFVLASENYLWRPWSHSLVSQSFEYLTSGTFATDQMDIYVNAYLYGR